MAHNLCTLFSFVLVLVYVSCSDLEISVTHEGECDKKSAPHDMLTMHYTGTIHPDGKKFDSSHDRGQPFTFQLGIGQVIKGWDEGLVGMCPGDKRVLIIPPGKAYGDQGAGDAIPPGATLKFEVELVSIGDAPPVQDIFGEIDEDGDKKLTKEEIAAYIKTQIPESERTGENDPETLTEQIFQHEDADRDGVISLEEFSGPKHEEL